MAESFDPTALLSKPLDEIKAPTPMPLGSYAGQVAKYEFDKAKNKDETPIVRFTVVATEAFPDVDEGELSAALGDRALNQIEHRLEFWLTPAALYRLKEFGVEHCKVDESSVANTAELIEATVGAAFGFEIGQVPNKKNPERPYHQITRTFALQ